MLTRLTWMALLLSTVACARHGERARAPLPAPARDPRSDFRPTNWEPFSPAIDAPPRELVLDALCSDAPDRCGACPDVADAAALASCALDARYAHDAEALDLARSLFARTGTVPGIDARAAVDGGYLGQVPTAPALPTGAYRKHLEWVVAALDDFDDLFARLTPKTTSAVLFRTRPHAFRFYRTEQPSYPSAFAGGGVVGYNLEGTLHTSREDVAETLFHELFHLNDEGHGNWSTSALSPIFYAVLERCGQDHACLTDYAPDATRVPGGTYYAFDARTADVREYAAEVALRWYREQRAALAGVPYAPAFRCLTRENAKAWSLVTTQFFGGIDIAMPCPEGE